VVWVEACRWWAEKTTSRIATSGEQCGQEEGKKEEWLMEEDSILEEAVSPNTQIAKEVACQNVAVKCM